MRDDERLPAAQHDVRDLAADDVVCYPNCFVPVELVAQPRVFRTEGVSFRGPSHDQGEVRHHVKVLVDGRNIKDRRKLTDRIKADSEVYVFQALSGG